jgi:hypothetical protein
VEVALVVVLVLLLVAALWAGASINTVRVEVAVSPFWSVAT